MEVSHQAVCAGQKSSRAKTLRFIALGLWSVIGILLTVIVALYVYGLHLDSAWRAQHQEYGALVDHVIEEVEPFAKRKIFHVDPDLVFDQKTRGDRFDLSLRVVAVSLARMGLAWGPFGAAAVQGHTHHLDNIASYAGTAIHVRNALSERLAYCHMIDYGPEMNDQHTYAVGMMSGARLEDSRLFVMRHETFHCVDPDLIKGGEKSLTETREAESSADVYGLLLHLRDGRPRSFLQAVMRERVIEAASHRTAPAIELTLRLADRLAAKGKLATLTALDAFYLAQMIGERTTGITIPTRQARLETASAHGHGHSSP